MFMNRSQLAKCLAKGNGKPPEEYYKMLTRRNKNIERRGYEYAFKREIKLSGGKNNEWGR